jgi:diaminohydroxyphosphoribosylaminopyrimidine deaminase/5-amino-6-(5-phosphoribosylamino)uracil reductase
MNELYMKRAIELASKGCGFVNPGPLSGAVIVKNNRIIGEGYYESFEGVSAEFQAVKNSTEDVRGSELYINIEPYLASGSYQSSLKTVLSSGFRKVYLGMELPALRSEKKFSDILKEAGVEVESGILSSQCEEQNEIYYHYNTKGTPFVFTKWAMTLDGKLATRTGDSKWISGEESLKFVHHLRQRVAAIMVGENTIRLDNPMLTTRLEGVKVSNPLRIILSRYGDIAEDANILRVDENTKTLIITSNKISNAKAETLLAKGVELLKLGEQNGKISFKDIIKALGKLGVDSLYIEGGSGVLASAFESGIVSKVYAAVAPKIVGGKDAFTPVGGSGIEKMKDAIVLRKVTHEIIGNDVVITGYI